MHKKIPPVRRKSIEDHLKDDQDYFGTLATVLDLLRQEMVENSGKRSHDELLVRLRDDLLYLQDKYRIEQRTN